jgi:DNA recombination protein RmuC
MKMLSPSVQDGSEDVTAQLDASTSSAPFIDGPKPVLWFGFGAFAFIFLVVILLIIRVRVIAPARRNPVNKHIFEPAGADAEITFDDPDLAPHELDAHKGKEEERKDSITAEAIAHPKDSPDPKHALIEDNSEEIEPLEFPKPAKVKKGRSPFSGLFSRKPKEKKPPHTPDQALDFVTSESAADEDIAKESIGSRPHFTPSNTADELNPLHSPVVDQLQNLNDDVEARRRQAEFDERERIAEEMRLEKEREEEEAAQETMRAATLEEERDRIYQSAREDALRDAEFERRKNEAALEQRLRSLASVERTLTEQADTLRTDTLSAQERLDSSLEERFAALSEELNDRLEQASTSIKASENEQMLAASQRNAAEMADYVGRELSNLRASIQDALKQMTRRIDNLTATPRDNTDIARELAQLKQMLQNHTTDVAEERTPLVDLIRTTLPAEQYVFNAALSNGRNADCCVTLPGDRAPFAIDAQYPIEAFDQYKRDVAESGSSAHAKNEYRRAVLSHIIDLGKGMIIPGETADSAFLFAPSDVIVSDLHANFPDLIQDSYHARVWIVSPASLMATLHTLNAVMAPIDEEAPSAAAPTDSQDDEILAEIENLRKRFTDAEQTADDASHNGAVTDTIEQSRKTQSDDADPDEPSRHVSRGPKAHVENGMGDLHKNYRSLSAEEEAFERLEREEELAEATKDEKREPQSGRPPFPLR